jgi:hypothetical protein
LFFSAPVGNRIQFNEQSGNKMEESIAGSWKQIVNPRARREMIISDLSEFELQLTSQQENTS